jgi:DNA uptake protein ComE-like DNA-binding protein
MSDLPSAQPDPRKLPAAWAIVPVISLGILSWAPFLYASVRTHARKYRILTGLYLGLAIIAGVLVAVSSGSGSGHSSLNDVAGLMLILLAGAGCAHTLSIRSEFGRQLELADDPRLFVAEQRVETRERALEIVRSDPKRAIALGVGRPDVPGSFDAGLVDINHVGANVLETLPGIDAEKAKRIVELRMNGSGFESAADLDMVLDIDPGTLTELSARAVFLPRF